MLFSATQTRKVEDLARISLKKEPLYVGVDDNKETATVDGLEQVKHKCYLKGYELRKTNRPYVLFRWVVWMPIPWSV